MIHSKEKSKYVCPDCGAEIEARPGQKIECDGHSRRVVMVEVKKGVTTK